MMGAEHIPADTAEDDQKWKDGLTEVIKQLRTTDLGTDVRMIAERIAEYRRDFIGDPSRVLRLAL